MAQGIQDEGEEQEGEVLIIFRFTYYIYSSLNLLKTQEPESAMG